MDEESRMNHDAIKQYLDEMQQQHILQISAATRANEQQIGGAHYAVKAIQPWDFIIANNIGYLEGNIIKYISRWKDKGGIEDLKKAQHYLQKLIETHDKERMV
jgi:Protein of unknwon function (DUF3310)